MGKKKQPIYKVVAADARSPRDGRFLEALGLYNPLTDPHTLELKEDRILYWLNVGAQPTHTVKSLLRQKGITLKKELQKKGLDEEKIAEELEKQAKLKEASANKKVTKKKPKKKAKEEIAEEPKEEVKAEEGSEKPEESKEANIEESTTEVKGAASEEKETEKE
jgi:small subunit ribosomal protein S16